jgi:hypothetical protein
MTLPKHSILKTILPAIQRTEKTFSIARKVSKQGTRIPEELLWLCSGVHHAGRRCELLAILRFVSNESPGHQIKAVLLFAASHRPLKRHAL